MRPALLTSTPPSSGRKGRNERKPWGSRRRPKRNGHARTAYTRPRCTPTHYARARARVYHYRKKDWEREKVGEERRKKKKKKRFPRQTSPVREKETVGNRASRNADADKGNPYDRFWCAGYLRSVSVYSDGTTGEHVFHPGSRDFEILRLFRSFATSIDSVNEIT